MDARHAGHAALSGWREPVADRLARPLAKKAPVEEDTVRAAIGFLFLALSAYYVVMTARRIARGT
jgi:hypothetical protein